MAFSTKQQLNNQKYFQGTGDTMNLSGSTIINGVLRYNTTSPSNFGPSSVAYKSYVTGNTYATITGNTNGISLTSKKRVKLGGNISGGTTFNINSGTLSLTNGVNFLAKATGATDFMGPIFPASAFKMHLSGTSTVFNNTPDYATSLAIGNTLSRTLNEFVGRNNALYVTVSGSPVENTAGYFLSNHARLSSGDFASNYGLRAKAVNGYNNIALDLIADSAVTGNNTTIQLSAANSIGGSNYALIVNNGSIVNYHLSNGAQFTAQMYFATGGTLLSVPTAGALEFVGNYAHYTDGNNVRRRFSMINATETLLNKTLTNPKLNTTSTNGYVWTATGTTGGGTWSPSAGGGISGATNLGTGNGLYTSVSSNKLQFKSLVAGSNITLTPSSTGITVSAGAGSGITGATNGLKLAGAGKKAALGGLLTGSTTITSNAKNQLAFNGNYTATADLDYYDITNPSLTGTSTTSHTLIGKQVSPTLVAGANTQHLVALQVTPTFGANGKTGLLNTGLWMKTANIAMGGLLPTYSLPGAGVDNGGILELSATAAGTASMLLRHTSTTGVWVRTFGNVLVFRSIQNSSIDFAQLGDNGTFLLQRPQASQTATQALLITAGAHTSTTLSTEVVDIDFAVNRIVQFATGALPVQRSFIVRRPDYAAVGASVIQNASTVSLIGPPRAGTNISIRNSAALTVEGGGLSSSITNGYGAIFNAPTGSTNRYAAAFNGTVQLGTTGNTGTSRILIAGGSSANIDIVVTPKGTGTLRYPSDLSANYNVRTLVDRGYVTGITNTLQTKASIVTYTGTTVPLTYQSKASIVTLTGTTLPATYQSKASITTYTGTTAPASYSPLDYGIIVLTGTTTLSATHKGKILHANGTFTITLPNGLSNGLNCTVNNIGSGTITLAATTTLNTKSSYTKLASQFGAATIYHAGSNIWFAFGDLSA